jgi:hypothetical protein
MVLASSDATESFAKFTTEVGDGWEGVKNLISSGDLKGAAKLAFAGVSYAFKLMTIELKNTWFDLVNIIKDSIAIINNSLGQAQDKTAIGIGKVADKINDNTKSPFFNNPLSQSGLALMWLKDYFLGMPKGTIDTLINDAKKNEKKGNEELEGIINTNKANKEKEKKDAANELEIAKKEYDALVKNSKLPQKKNMEEIEQALKGIDRGAIGIGQSTLGAFQFGNAAQFFGGSNSYQGRMEKIANEQTKLLAAIAGGISSVPLLRIE